MAVSEEGRRTMKGRKRESSTEDGTKSLKRDGSLRDLARAQQERARTGRTAGQTENSTQN